MEIAEGGDCGSVIPGAAARLLTAEGAGRSAADDEPEIAPKANWICASFVCTALKWPVAGISLWQQPCDAGMGMLSHPPFICLQQVCSAAVR